MRPLGAFFLSALTLAPATALGWSGESLCALSEVMLDGAGHAASAFDDAAGICELPRLHLPNPTFDSCAPMSGRESAKEAPLVAARALARARELDARGLHEDALLNLRVVEATMPRIADYVALMRAELHERRGDAVRAAAAYREARERGQTQDLEARAHVGYVLNLLRARDPRAESELSGLMRRFPELPEGATLTFEHALAREAAGQTRAAAATYRTLDLTLPGYPVARKARERLAALATIGVTVAPLSDQEVLARAERLLKSGPIDLAQQAVAEIADRPVAKSLLAQRDGLVVALTNLENRMTVSSERTLVSAMGSVSNPEREALERKIRLQLVDKKKLAKQRPAFFLQWLYPACEMRLSDVADELIEGLVKKAQAAPADVRFKALTVAAGTASEETLISLADTLVHHPSLAAAARYHRARALERLGRIDEAKRQLAQVQSVDTSATRFYANWADQRLRALGAASDQPVCRAPGRRAECNKERVDSVLARLEAYPGMDVQAAIRGLAPIAEEHGLAYPWLARALDLLRLGELDAAGDELHEAYLAFRFVSRRGARGALRAGRQAVYRAASVQVATQDPQLRRQRLALDMPTRERLAKIASDIGDHGTAGLFGGGSWIDTQPEPYAHTVARVARKYNLDPDLLFAVMRVESVYQRRIISHAGAIGLMQIMPRTGRLIADQLGRYDATTTDLLDPTTNLEFSAWYLSSLLERMDGRLPLAIASYNGGPHNVRRWIREYGAHVPLDAFLERIPFAETKRYVRRVLGFYVRYKAQRGQKMDLMAVTLPGEKPSEIAF